MYSHVHDHALNQRLENKKSKLKAGIVVGRLLQGHLVEWTLAKVPEPITNSTACVPSCGDSPNGNAVA